MKHSLSCILFFFCCIAGYSQVVLRAETDKRELSEDGTFRLTVVLEISGEKMLEQETKVRLPDLSKFDYLGDGSEQNTIFDPKRGVMVNQQIFQFALSPKISGRLKIGSATVQVNGKIYKTEPFDIVVTEAEARKAVAENSSNSDIFLSVELRNKEVYQNQPVVAVVRAVSQDFSNFRRIANVKFPEQKNIIVRPISSSGNDIERGANGASQVLAEFEILPQESGLIDLPAATAVVKYGGKSVKIKSNSPKISVKSLPLPPPVGFSRAIGNFKLDIRQNLSREAAEIGKPVNVTVKLSGNGNLDEGLLPKLKHSADYEFYSPKITNRTHHSKNGIRGNIEATYVVIPKVSGNVSVATENFAYFNPSAKKYVELGEQATTLTILSPEQVSDAKTAMEKVNDYTNNVLETVNETGIKTEKFKIKEKKLINWNTILLNYGLLAVLFFLLWYFFSPKKKKSAIAQNTGAAANSLSDFRPEEHLKNLEKLAFRGDYDGFIAGLEELEQTTEKHLMQSRNMTLRQYLEREKGAATTEEYRLMQQRTKVEKYAPQHTPQEADEILKMAKNIFSGIEF